MSPNLQVKSNESRPAFAVLSIDTDSTSSETLIEILEGGDRKRSIVKAETIQEAIASEAEVMVLQTKRDPEMSDEILEKLKGYKVIGIGYGTAQLFGHLGLEINGGACAHNPSDCTPTISFDENTLIRNSGLKEAFNAFELSPDTMHQDANFAMYIPRKSHLRSVVEVIARWTGDENYGSIVRQGNCIMIGLDAPPPTWTPQYRRSLSYWRPGTHRSGEKADVGRATCYPQRRRLVSPPDEAVLSEPPGHWPNPESLPVLPSVRSRWQTGPGPKPRSGKAYRESIPYP